MALKLLLAAVLLTRGVSSAPLPLCECRALPPSIFDRDNQSPAELRFRQALVATGSACRMHDASAIRDEASNAMMAYQHAASAQAQRMGLNWDLRVFERGGEHFYPWVFSKLLTHDPETGFAKKADVDTLLAAVQCPSLSTVQAIALSPVSARKLEGITNAQSRNLMGQLARTCPAPPTFRIDSAEMAFQMAEVYAMQLLRDVPFSAFDTDPTVRTVVDELNKFASKTTAPTAANGLITPATLLRGGQPGTTIGPHVSQFMLQPFWYGNLDLIVQRYVVELDPNNALTQQGWLDVQNGVTVAAQNPALAASTFVHTGRVLGGNAHMDPLYAWYFNAALLAMQNKIPAFGLDSPMSSAWATGGAPDVLASVAHVSLLALRAAWHKKWNINMAIRPEVLAQRIELADTRADLRAAVPGLAALFSALNGTVGDGLLRMVKADNAARTGGNESLFLAGQYVEGSPPHPTLPSGHAAVSGACVTVLKAMLQTFDNNDKATPTKWAANGRAVLEASADGSSLVAYGGADAAQMTVNGELNKLGSNIAMGRDWGGVHFRMDADGGMKLGEDLAISYLLDKLREYSESETNGMLDGWMLEKLDGSVVWITRGGVVPA